MGIWFIIKRIAYFFIDNWKIVVPIIALIIVGLWFRSCWSKHKAKLNERQIIAAQQAIAKQDREEMVKVLTEVAVEEKQIDGNVANADRQKVEAISDARKRAAGMSNAELAAELERLASE